MLRSQKQAKKLDVTGVLGASCGHEMPLMFVNVSQGERQVYATVVTSLTIDPVFQNDNSLV